MGSFSLRSLLVFCLLLLSQHARSQVSPVSSPDSINNYVAAVVKVDTTGNPRGNRRSHEIGTGFIFHQAGFILTAGHVVGDGEEWQEEPDGINSSRKVIVYRKVPGKVEPEPQRAVVIYYDKQLDLALLRISCEPECRVIKFGNSSLVTDETKVQAIAWGNRDKAETLDSTKLLNNCDFKYFCLFKLNQNAIGFGDSGGPLFNEKFEVVGMIKSKGADAKGNVLATPINLSAPLRLLADIEQPETKARFHDVNQSLKTLNKIAQDLRQNIRPAVEWYPVSVGDKRERWINLNISRDFEDQYLPQNITVTIYPAWKVTPKGTDQTKETLEMTTLQAKTANPPLFFFADSDAVTIEQSVMKQTAISKSFESSFKTILKARFVFSDATLDSLTIPGAEVVLKWSLPNMEKPKTRIQILGAAP